VPATAGITKPPVEVLRRLPDAIDEIARLVVVALVEVELIAVS